MNDFVHIGPSYNVEGVSIGKSTLVGAGATILPNIVIGKNVIIGAGTLVNKNIPDETKVLGIPAKLLMMKRNRIFLSPPHLGHLEAKNVSSAFSSNWISHGPFINEFEKKLQDTVKEKMHVLFNLVLQEYILQSEF